MSMKINKGKDYTKDKYDEYDWIMSRKGYARCVQCAHFHTLEETSTSNWTMGVCSDECLDDRYPNKDSLAHKRREESK